ncbi:histidine--tRNA ligase [Acetobacter oeni]|uniref:Histidine--tRNA ligase n=2 Tax=Acetobacter oeni TaxID=304077 RepID=A0A511XL29_9PROT|nr:histidine--tRNA ligase [Acetobacter oeni]MBB3883205.1 histidyl-tRNA synthetase [Acetobacter oeni]NHO19271.1 histidine--tRNA ligase [Acetobacter oeni]GEN63646.1 histidine--tRNA ligase [Acetobacter oeni]
MNAVKPVRGTHDLIGEQQRRHAHVIATARRITGLYGFEEWATPVFEDTSVFARSLGDTSDVVSKEMYTFSDRGGESLTLRPEGTAGICRALVTNGLTQSLPQKAFYAGPMFRYERPQKGRYRQFHQIGAELIGSGEPLADAETITMGRDVLEALGIVDEVVLELNTLGDAESRATWRTALVAYFSDYRNRLSEDSQLRLEHNPLRILDSKAAEDQPVIEGAPGLEQYLNDSSRHFWDDVRRGLDVFNVAYTVNPRIVRGLDYYSHTAFEFVTNRLGAQGTVLAGGRYDGLVEEMGGPATPAIGWAGGIERLAMLLDEAPDATAPIAIIPLGAVAETPAIRIMTELRAAGLRSEMAYRGNLKKRMERANRAGASYAIILGEAELASGVVQLRDLSEGQQREVAPDDLVKLLSHTKKTGSSV